MIEATPNTKERLLKAACRIFAEKGFRDATVAEICEMAEANIAAVNYHFGDKEKLYDEVWRHAFAIAASTYPVDGGVPEDTGIEESLYGYASAILHRIFSEGEAGLFPRLLNQEMAAPTLALDKIAKEALFPQRRQVEKTIKKMFGEACDEHVLWLCQHSIIGQCAFYNFSRPLRERVMGCGTMSEESIDIIARHIARFSLGGLKEIQK
ncbi:MAG: CerR family C-terminal domain-containing protein [Kiritimatiellales bacterium]|nr:CerR family C-terminal domain-containing protein [Kiritimatiellales bacterium]MCF7863959.1 CerR family C-terminal domain-containing protein [Kiritimatiellales bacterium]